MNQTEHTVFIEGELRNTTTPTLTSTQEVGKAGAQPTAQGVGVGFALRPMLAATARDPVAGWLWFHLFANVRNGRKCLTLALTPLIYLRLCSQHTHAHTHTEDLTQLGCRQTHQRDSFD